MRFYESNDIFRHHRMKNGDKMDQLQRNNELLKNRVIYLEKELSKVIQRLVESEATIVHIKECQIRTIK